MKCLSLAAVLILAGCGKAADAPAPAPSAPATPQVPVAKVVSRKLEKPLRVTGELRAFRNVALYARVPGYVEKIGVDVGAVVKAGQRLADLSAPELVAQKGEIEARLAAAEATQRRLKEASATPGVVAGNDLDLALRSVDTERARLKVVAEQIQYLGIDAPFGGVITERGAHEGSMVGPSATMPLLRLQQVDRLRLVASVPEVAAGGIEAGGKLGFSVAAFPGRIFEGVIARLPQALDPRTRTLPVELDVDNGSGKLAPGMFVEVHWTLKRPEASLWVPGSAVAVTSERVFVIRVKEGRAEWVDVRQGFSSGDLVEVFGGLSEGDWVASRGTDELRSGTAVIAKEPPAAPARP